MANFRPQGLPPKYWYGCRPHKDGGRIFWVAPSGGRDRRSAETGKFEPAVFDPASVGLFHLLAQKASRFPNTELAWDRSSSSITNHEEADATIVRRNYRDGFAPPEVG